MINKSFATIQAAPFQPDGNGKIPFVRLDWNVTVHHLHPWVWKNFKAQHCDTEK